MNGANLPNVTREMLMTIHDGLMLPRPLILAVDDSPDSLLLIQGVLEDSYLLALVDNGLDALKRATTEPFPDLILLDVMMPGRDAIVHAEQELGVEIEVLTLAKEIAYCHHETWDGSGYPEGLAGEQIPVSARLMALADVYDALISRRVYKEPMTHAQAVALIAPGRGKDFDPAVGDAFMALQEDFSSIALAYSESNADIQRKMDYIDVALR